MSDFVEAVVTLIPAEAGGRRSAIFPRLGSYRPFVSIGGGARFRIRVIEGPPSIAPGHAGQVVAEIEGAAYGGLGAGAELDLIEDGQCVGILHVTRLCRAVTEWCASPARAIFPPA